MIAWLWFFIPLWVTGFTIGFYAKRINRWLDEPKAFVIK
tara:strand:+ start:7228 stop:7344 length:117 start_codon:yes stop_codon:yes gene_type:complete